MKALVCAAPNKAWIEDRPEPTASAGEVLLGMGASASAVPTIAS